MINIPLLETVATRQCETAMIARNFYYNGINLLFPQFDHFGNFSGTLVMEIGLLPALTAIGYFITGGVHEWIARLISIIFSIGTVIFLYFLVKNIFNKKTALWACFCFYLSPLSIIYTRTFQPDSAMLFFTISGFYFFYKYFNSHKLLHIIPGILFIIISIALKITSIYILLPICYLFWQENKSFKFLYSYKFCIIMLSTILPSAGWYVIASHISALIPNDQVIGVWSFSNWFKIKTLLSYEYLHNFIEITAGKTLTPIGLFFFAKSLYKNFNQKNALLYFWLSGVLIYMFLFCENTLSHKYYYLPLLIIGSIFIGVELGKENFGFKNPIKKSMKIILAILVFISIITQIKSAYTLDEKYKYTVEAGKKLQKISTDKNDLVLATRRIYYCNRKGWRFNFDADDSTLIKKFNEFKDNGCKYFVVTELNEFDKFPEFRKYVENNNKLKASEQGFLIFKINN